VTGERRQGKRGVSRQKGVKPGKKEERGDDIAGRGGYTVREKEREVKGLTLNVVFNEREIAAISCGNKHDVW
jgi:hypothetical protein